MPYYTFVDTETNEVETKMMTILEREKYLASNPNIKQTLATPSIGDPVRMGVTKTPDGFNDLVKHAKKSHLHSTIQTRN